MQKPLKTVKYFGHLTKSEFQLRCGFIKKRIEKRLLREEVAFLMGKNLHLVESFEEMAGGIKFNGIDTEILSLILGEDQKHLLTPDPLDLDIRSIHGIKTVSNGKTCYKMNHNWSNTPIEETTFIHETTTNKILAGEITLLKKTVQEVERLIETGYFATSQSGLTIYRLMQKILSNDIRPILIKKAIYFSIQEKKLISYRKDRYFRYRKRL